MNLEGMFPQIFHEQMQLMKDMLERGEMIFGGDRENPGYKRFKQETMRVHYNAIDAFWTLLQENGLTEKCECNAMARRWSDCKFCGGSGFKAINKKEATIHTVNLDAEGNPVIPDHTELRKWAEERSLKLAEEAPSGTDTDSE